MRKHESRQVVNIVSGLCLRAFVMVGYTLEGHIYVWVDKGYL